MAIVVVGSVAFDSIETPSGKVTKVLGGSTTYFALAARFFTEVRVIGVVGDDFLPEHEAVLTDRGIDTRGIERAPGLSFHWTGQYSTNLSEAKTLATDLNVFADFQPKIPAAYADTEYLFLGNIEPTLQLQVRKQMPNVKLVCGDTMNLWIEHFRSNLLPTLAEVDVLLINDGEAKLLSGETNMVLAAKKVMELGPKSVVIKHGEFGATAFFSDGTRPFRAPALPLAEVKDPTGAGDSFAGGFYGYLASQPKMTPAVLRKALFYGGVMGSFTVEQFGTDRLAAVTPAEIEDRFKLFVELSHLGGDE
jgi:sugar/nucleoside kinase (ribokinase family)